jgi:hypothetical protein
MSSIKTLEIEERDEFKSLKVTYDVLLEEYHKQLRLNISNCTNKMINLYKKLMCVKMRLIYLNSKMNESKSRVLSADVPYGLKQQ